MKFSKWMFAALLAVCALVALPTAAYAAGSAAPALDEVVFGHDFTLEAGRMIDGDLVVIGGSLTMEKGSVVSGQAVVIGGSATILGHVQGDLVVVGGEITMSPAAIVDGDLVVPTGTVDVDPAAQVGGRIIDDVQFPWGDNALNNDYAYDYEYTRGPGVARQFARGIVGDFVWLLFRSVAMATVALLLILFMQKPMERVASTLLGQAPLSGGIGLVGVVVTGFATIALGLTIILIPVAALLPFVLVVAWGFGWISMGLEVGRRMGEAFKANWSPALQAPLGTFALTFASGVVAWVPCLGWILGVVIGLAGLGAVILTRFGSQSYPDATVSVAPVAPAPALPAPRKRTVAKKAPAKRARS
ncbi:MAG: polymer-forming cytoskeletal protein [Anaerolineales bacterium]|nr:polymer-forming cytoskeletal protein [Anaerolineales bacterium]MBX3004322.1 polymer-forming cytoskeletal protein [Anaerolineales bacterium]MCW5839426.1 polymer-forming cytoskeletal protein [Anaerolineales bacterium]